MPADAEAQLYFSKYLSHGIRIKISGLFISYYTKRRNNVTIDGRVNATFDKRLIIEALQVIASTEIFQRFYNILKLHP